MARQSNPETIDLLDELSPTLWAIALVFFGLGDYATTFIGLQTGRVIEVGPIAAMVVPFGMFPLAVLKVASIALFYVLWKIVPSPYNLGIPLGLAVLGVLVTMWNTTVLFVVLT